MDGVWKIESKGCFFFFSFASICVHTQRAAYIQQLLICDGMEFYLKDVIFFVDNLDILDRNPNDQRTWFHFSWKVLVCLFGDKQVKRMQHNECK